MRVIEKEGYRIKSATLQSGLMVIDTDFTISGLLKHKLLSLGFIRQITGLNQRYRMGIAIIKPSCIENTSYIEQITDCIDEFLNTDAVDLYREHLHNKIISAIEIEDYETAAEIRDKILELTL